MAPTFGHAAFHIADINTPQLFMVVLTFLLVTFFDTAGTLIGMTQQAGMVDDNGKIPGLGRAFLSDSLAMVEGALMGTAPLGTSVESSAGIAMGGRTGLTAIFVGIFFLISIAYPITMIAARRHKEVSPMMYVLFFIFIIFFLITNMK